VTPEKTLKETADAVDEEDPIVSSPDSGLFITQATRKRKKADTEEPINFRIPSKEIRTSLNFRIKCHSGLIHHFTLTVEDEYVE
jgi:hypothetical protein